MRAHLQARLNVWAPEGAETLKKTPRSTNMPVGFFVHRVQTSAQTYSQRV